MHEYVSIVLLKPNLQRSDAHDDEMLPLWTHLGGAMPAAVPEVCQHAPVKPGSSKWNLQVAFFIRKKLTPKTWKQKTR